MTVPAPSELRALTERLREFAAARDWEQFHTPKNLAMALIAEAGEQWRQAGHPSRPCHRIASSEKRVLRR